MVGTLGVLGRCGSVLVGILGSATGAVIAFSDASAFGKGRGFGFAVGVFLGVVLGVVFSIGLATGFVGCVTGLVSGFGAAGSGCRGFATGGGASITPIMVGGGTALVTDSELCAKVSANTAR